MKVKECLAETLNEGSNSFTWFLRSMALLLVMDSCERLKQIDGYGLCVGGEKSSYRKTDNPSVDDLIKVLNHSDLLRGSMQSAQLACFFKWFIEQEAPTYDDYDYAWNDLEFIAECWNDFAREQL